MFDFMESDEPIFNLNSFLQGNLVEVTRNSRKHGYTSEAK
jgi:hypothetical protein